MAFCCCYTDFVRSERFSAPLRLPKALKRSLRTIEQDSGVRTLRALITGIAGFAGSHLADYLVSLGEHEVYGISLPGESPRNIAHLRSQIALHPLDLLDEPAVRALLGAIAPDWIFHLAAQASVERAWANPAETLVNNITIQLNLFQAVLALDLHPRILVVGSADEYGLVQPEDLPIDEETPLRPVNPYAVSKIAQDYLGYQYYLSHGLDVVRVRPFNQIGPRQGPGFVTADFARQIALIEAGKQEPVLRVGNLQASRDLTDVRDMVRGYVLALSRGRAGEVYNLGSARAYTIQELLDRLLRLSCVPIQVAPDAARMRPSDIPMALCDGRRFARDTGWQPEYDLDTSLRDVLEDWRQRVRTEA